MTVPRYAKPAILQEIDLNRHHLIEASAGTGKTYTIEHLVVELVLSGVKLKKILLVTFTEKATQELRDRIRGKLRELLDHMEVSPEPHAWVLDQSARSLLEDALFEFEDASIDTIHGYCNTVLREFAFENGLRFELEQKNKKQILEDIFHEHLRQSVLAKDSSLRQLLADFLTEHPNGLDFSKGPVFKQSLMQKAEKLATLNGTYLPDLDRAESIWIQWRDWFTAQDEIPAFNQLNLASKHRGPITDTYAAMRSGLTQETTLSQLFTWLDQNKKGLDLLVHPEKWQFNKRKIKELGNPIMGPGEAPASLHRLVEETRTLQQISCSLEARLLLHLMPGVEEALTQKKQLMGWFDFDDMIRLVAKGLTEESGGERLRDALRTRHSHALIDEFQDTDADQWTIFSRVFLGSDSHKLFLIGDPKQAIYRFRGADIHTYLEAREAIQRIGGKQIGLHQNFRSSPELINGVNTLFNDPKLFKNRIEFQEVTAGKPNNRMTRNTGPAVVCLFPDEDQKYGTAELNDLFAEGIAVEIRDLLVDPPHLPEDRPLAPRDIAVLTRSRAEAERVGAALSQEGVAFAFYKQGGLFKSREAKDFFTLLEAIENHRDDAYVFKALLTRFFPVGLEDLLRWRTVPDNYRSWLAEWHKQIYLDRDYRALFSDIFSKTGLFERQLFLGDAEREVTNYEHLADILKQEGARLDLKQLLRRFHDFMDDKFDMDQDLLRLESEAEAVQVMTIHASKGLEFPVVFLYGAYSDRKRPDWFHDFHHPQMGRVLDLGVNHPEEHLQEQREELERLYYVALTRAKFKLYITHNPPKKINANSHVLSGPLQRLREEASCAEVGFETQHPSAREPQWEQPAPSQITEAWQPVPANNATVAKRLRDLRYSRDLFRMTSYTRLAQNAHHGETGLIAEETTLLIQGLDEAPETPAPQALNLPKGRQTGICLHEILERITDLKTAEYQDLDTWRDDEKIQRLIMYYLKRAGLSNYYETAATVIWHALKQPVMEGICLGEVAGPDRLHEVDFYYPVRKPWGEREQTVMLNGSIDLAFRRNQRYYFADWKSDTLEDYRSSVLHKKVQEDYRIQIQIYLWAMLRWLGVTDQEAYETRFGGLFYFFLRGMVGGEGVYFYRPDWEEADQYRRDLEALV